jgi:hypothetical protein
MSLKLISLARKGNSSPAIKTVVAVVVDSSSAVRSSLAVELFREALLVDEDSETAVKPSDLLTTVVFLDGAAGSESTF